MSVSSLALSPYWRDYWGMWNAFVEPYLAPLELSQCHAPRFCVLPQVAQQTIPASGKVQYNFRLQPGSIIWGLFPLNTSTDFLGPVSVQLRDVELGHDFFQSPISTDQLQVKGDWAGVDFPSYTPMLPHPVVGEGLFTFEMWGPVGTLFVMLLGVAEVTDCPVR